MLFRIFIPLWRGWGMANGIFISNRCSFDFPSARFPFIRAFGFFFFTLFGLLAGLIGTRIAGNFVSVSGPADILPLGLTAIASLAVSTICGGMSIPLTFRFGPEKGRLLVLVSFFVPSIICYIVYRLLLILGIVLTDELIVLFLYCSPLLALVWNFAMYRISCAILSKKEF